MNVKMEGGSMGQSRRRLGQSNISTRIEEDGAAAMVRNGGIVGNLGKSLT